jgi:hypothetical protein
MYENVPTEMVLLGHEIESCRGMGLQLLKTKKVRIKTYVGVM